MRRGHWLNSYWKSSFMGLLGWLSISVFACKTFAQSSPSNIVPDNTLGAESSQVLPNYQGQPIEAITGGATRGINLFHSFEELNVTSGRRGYFISPNAEIQNIFSRVTGRNGSEILGTLGIYGDSQANLFLINPNGIVFGENASLDVGGSFVGTTANGLQFGNQGVFSVTNPQVPSQLLTVSPSALFFNQINQSAGILNRSIAPAGRDSAGFDAFGLRVPDGKSLLLLGGNVNVDGGRLNAFGGRVELAGLSTQGSVGLQENDNNLSFIFPQNVELADILFRNNAFVNVSSAGSGDININARNVEFSESELGAGIAVGNGTSTSKAGNIAINATETINLTENSYIYNTLQTNATGQAGDIKINSGSLNLDSGSVFVVSTYGNGDAGNISINASDSVILNNAFISSFVEAGGIGNAGNVDINAASLSLQDASQILTLVRDADGELPAGRGNAGNVNINVAGTVAIADGQKESFRTVSGIGSDVQAGAVGNAGNITIAGDSLLLDSGAQITTNTSGEGNAGNVFLNAKDLISLTGDARIYSTVGVTSVGEGGSIQIDTNSLSLQDSTWLMTNTYGQGSASDVIINAREDVLLDGGIVNSIVAPRGVGNGGNLFIKARNLALNNGSLQTSVWGSYENLPAGRGNAGKINIDVRDTVNISGVDAGLYSLVEEGAIGNGGNIDIKTGSFFISNGAELFASVFGKGSAGNININARENINFDKGYAYSTVGYLGEGKGGDINIKAGSLFFTNGTEISTGTFGRGDAGNVKFSAADSVFLSDNTDVNSTVEEGGIGKGGNIDINATSVALKNNASFSASTFGEGDAGNVFVRVQDDVSLINEANIFSSVEAGGVGNGGNIDINATSLSIENGSALVAIVRGDSENQPGGQGNAGNVNISVTNTVKLANDNDIDKLTGAIASRVESETEGDGGDIKINAGSLSVLDGVIISASNFGEGNAGNIIVDAKDAILLSGASPNKQVSSGFYARTEGGGKGGNIEITSNSLSVRNGAQIAASTEKQGNAGNILITANKLETIDGGQILTSTFGSGSAGTITVNVPQEIKISGKYADFDEVVAKFPENYSSNVGANSGFFVLSRASGNTGDIKVTSPKITLDNQGVINAESVSGNGGNINLEVADLLLMRRNSQISTNAGTAQQGGDGGNIDIDSKFIIAIPEENSDITANAFTGTGGKVQIFSQGVFGIEPRQQSNNITSDITASSDQGVQGVTTVDAPDNSSIQNSLNQLSENPIDANALIANSCIARRNTPSSGTFFITGKGGLPERPGEAGISRFSTGGMQDVSAANVSAFRREWKIGDSIIEPTGVYKLADGRLILSRECD